MALSYFLPIKLFFVVSAKTDTTLYPFLKGQVFDAYTNSIYNSNY
jgi:hypothetical protein